MAVEPRNLLQDLLTALLQFVQALDRLQIRYALIGGVATGYRSLTAHSLWRWTGLVVPTASPRG